MRTKYADCERPLIQLDGDDNATLGVVMDPWTVFANVAMTVPAGFRTDGASIPRALWRICGHPLEVPRIFAAAAHDYLYGGGVAGVTRSEADRCYYRLLRHFGVGSMRAHIEYFALRLCGWTHWCSSLAVLF